MDRKINVDILILVAKNGGVENILNALSSYLSNNGFYVRIIQLVYENDSWVNSGIEFIPVYNSRLDINLEKLYQGYKNVLTDSDTSPDIILATASPYMSYIGKRAAEELGINARIISYLHTLPKIYEASGFGGIEALGYADCHFAISDLIYSNIRSAFPNDKIFRVNNPILCDIKHIDTKRDKYKLSFIGRLSPEKSVDTIIRAIAKTRHTFNLSVVGQGEEEESLRQLVDNLNLNSKVEFLGWQDNPWEHIHNSYALIIASAYEGFSLAVIEALAHGMAVISTPVSGSVEVIRPGENGFLFPYKDVAALTKILDFIAEEKLPYIDSKVCIDSVREFGAKEVFSYISKIFRALV